MKKIKILIGILYINTITLITINISLIKFKIYSALITFFITKEEPEIIFDNLNYNNLMVFNNILQTISSILPILFLIFLIINIIDLVSDYKNNNLKILYNKMKMIKIGLIPYWIINFICFIPISIVFLVAGHGFGFIMVPLFIFVSYIVLIITSIFSIIYLRKLQENNIIIKKQFIIHTILQLFFIIDIIDIIYILKKWDKPNGI